MERNSATLSGTLYLVATPIGNLDDITLRALHVLKTVHLILAENPRHAKKLLEAHGIQQPLVAYHQHNEAEKAPRFLQRLQQGDSLALISDAGTPLIQDPGFPLIQLAIKEQVAVVPIPGACALITALCAAGVPSHAFLFSGFLPPKASARRGVLTNLQSSTHTLIFYESIHRIQQTLHDIEALFGPHYEFVLAKELTKARAFYPRTAATILQFLKSDLIIAKGICPSTTPLAINHYTPPI